MPKRDLHEFLYSALVLIDNLVFPLWRPTPESPTRSMNS
jgi:hypothetical protein